MSSNLREVPGAGHTVFAASQRDQVLASWRTRTVRELTLSESGRRKILGVLSFGTPLRVDLLNRADMAFASFLLRTQSQSSAYDAVLAFEMEVTLQSGRRSLDDVFAGMLRPVSTVGDVGYFPPAVRGGVPAREVPGSGGVPARGVPARDSYYNRY